MVTRKKCAHCGLVNSSNDQICRRCKTQLEEVSNAPASSSAQSNNESTLVPSKSVYIGRGYGFGLAMAGLALTTAPWLIVRYLGMVSGKATAAGFLAGWPLALYGASCVKVPTERVWGVSDKRTDKCIVIGIVLAGIETFFFGQYLDLW